MTGLAEAALRVRDLPRSLAFYRDVLGLADYAVFDGVAFLEIGGGEPGHPALLALFEQDWPSTREAHGWSGLDPQTSPLHHLALSTRVGMLSDWEARLAAADVAFNRRVFEWAGWRSLFFQDVDGNVVELVAVDRSLARMTAEPQAGSYQHGG